MFFRRKGKLRRETDQKLWDSLNTLKEDWMRNKLLVEKSIDPSVDLLNDLKTSEAKYFYLIREAKVRRLSADRK